MEVISSWLRSRFPFTSPDPPKAKNKSQKNRSYQKSPSIPSVSLTGKKRRFHIPFSFASDSYHSPPPQKKRAIDPIPYYTPVERKPRELKVFTKPTLTSRSPSPKREKTVMSRKPFEEPNEVIVLSSDDEYDDIDGLFPTGSSSTDYEYEASKVIELARLQNESILDLSFVDDQVQEEESVEDESSSSEYNDGVDELFALPDRKREEFERKKALKLERISKSLAQLRSKAGNYEREKRNKKSAAERKRPLTTDEENMVEQILYGGSDSQTIVDDITRHDLRTLDRGQWLNDVVINSYLNLVAKRSKDHPEDYPKIHCMSTYFYSTLTRSGSVDYSRVRRWTSKVDLFAMDKIIVPIHLGAHWTMAVIKVKENHIDYYDSMGSSHHCVFDLKKYMIEEYKDKKKLTFTGNWTHASHGYDVPQQRNGYDCGVFTCRFGECEARNSKFDFSQKDMPLFRKRMILEIVSKNIAL